ncbi:MAG: helix-turn-helix domain-containing protein [Deltaproteobacteria bacterium]|nr:helix-turn-helix domain-containing protein [Deltaproteobacteria bacterium]
MASAPRVEGLVVPTSEAQREAEAVLTKLGPLLKRRKAVRLSVESARGTRSERVLLPPLASDLLRQILELLASGNAISLLPVQSELTTQEAADLVNVSRPYLIKLLEEGRIPFRLVGSHRRIKATDLLAFKEKDDAERRTAADELARAAQDLDLGY